MRASLSLKNVYYMGNYKLTRKEAAESLDMSMRSIDRYIKAGKLRAKKKGKIVYLHSDDIDNIWGDSDSNKHIIITNPSSNTKTETSSTKLSKKADVDKLTKTFDSVYSDLRSQIDKKDEIIQKLSIQVGRADEQMKHSISVSEHNKSQMLLEESRWHITAQMSSLTEDKKSLEEELKNEKFDKKVLIVFVFLLLAVSAYFFFTNV